MRRNNELPTYACTPVYARWMWNLDEKRFLFDPVYPRIEAVLVVCQSDGDRRIGSYKVGSPCRGREKSQCTIPVITTDISLSPSSALSVNFG